MKKVLVLVLAMSLTMAVLAGCGKDESNQGGVVITAGNSADNTSKYTAESTEMSESSSESSNESTEVADISSNETEETNKVESKTMLGTWESDNGDVIQLTSEDSLIYIELSSGNSFNGTYETDWKTYLNVEYTIKKEIKNPTEQQKLMNDIYEEEVITKEYKIKNIVDNTKLNYIEVETDSCKFNVYVDTSLNNEDTTTEEGVVITEVEMTPEEIEAHRQSLIEQGIDPDTGLPLENVQKLIEMGIDPSTGLPLETVEQ